MNGGVAAETGRAGVRIGVIALNTWHEATRQRLFGAIALLAFGLTVAVLWLRDLNFGASELKFAADFGFGAMAFFGAALAIAVTTQLFFSEIDHPTVLTLLAKPVRRAEYLTGKFVGAALVMAAFCALLTGLLATVLWTREAALARTSADSIASGARLDYLALAGAGFAQWLKLVVLAALTLLVASFARTQLFTAVCGFMILVICHLQDLAREAATHAGVPVWRGFALWISVVLPDFQAFDFSGAIFGDLIWSRLAGVTLYSFGYVTVTCALACISFQRREI